ncbi:MAG: selenide, water dikinase SelD [Acidobacteria bacterium RIFCSPLOWO2_12_FULL_59_11]|nr:MAG: selenide, water dikinase SelD [Acidobacteria bacterium RIFCSPLOWO2_12_FULL_59_11]
MPQGKNENVLVGFDTADDAGVYRLSAKLALVQTVDFFTPIVDDPFTFGEIAAANSLSDVYAMGGKPLSALSIVAFPAKGDIEVLEQILQGGFAKMQEAGCAVLGGHSIADEEIKFGFAVTGTIDPARVLTNAGARPGDALILTKRLGTGVISTALKKGKAMEKSVAAAIESMRTLNRQTCEVTTRFSEENSNAVHAATDVTGFGLLGHAREMALASKVTIEIDHRKVKVLPGALEAIRQGFLPGGLKNNREFASCSVSVAANVPPEIETLLYDPQTSGGLLISVAAASAPSLESALRAAKIPAAIIGQVTKRGEHPIIVV